MMIRGQYRAPTEHELQTGTAATDHIDNRSEDGQTHPRNRAALEAWRGYQFTKRKERQGQTMGGGRKRGGWERRGNNDDAARKSLSRRSILNILKGVSGKLLVAVILGKETIVAFAQQITGVLGSPSAADDDPRKPAAAAVAQVRRRHQREHQGIEALVAAARRAAQGGAKRPAHHDRRSGLWRRQRVRRRHSDACA